MDGEDDKGVTQKKGEFSSVVVDSSTMGLNKPIWGLSLTLSKANCRIEVGYPRCLIMFEDHVSIQLKIDVMGTDSPDSEQLAIQATNILMVGVTRLIWEVGVCP